MKYRALYLICWLLGSMLLLAACSSASSAPATDEVMTLNVGVRSEDLAFDKERLTVQAGQQIRLRFTNTSQMVEHNWVLVPGGEDVANRVNQAGKAAGPARDYLAEDATRVIAHTWLLYPGESDEVTFTAPTPGTYLYICTVPGHYESGMIGELIVEP